MSTISRGRSLSRWVQFLTISQQLITSQSNCKLRNKQVHTQTCRSSDVLFVFPCLQVVFAEQQEIRKRYKKGGYAIPNDALWPLQWSLVSRVVIRQEHDMYTYLLSGQQRSGPTRGRGPWHQGREGVATRSDWVWQCRSCSGWWCVLEVETSGNTAWHYYILRCGVYQFWFKFKLCKFIFPSETITKIAVTAVTETQWGIILYITH